MIDCYAPKYITQRIQGFSVECVSRGAKGEHSFRYFQYLSNGVHALILNIFRLRLPQDYLEPGRNRSGPQIIPSRSFSICSNTGSLHLLNRPAYRLDIDIAGLVLDNGVWQAPTPATVLRDLLANAAAREADLRQRYDTRPAAELDAFAAELGRIMRDGSSRESGNAEWALIKASSNSYGGTPYAGAADAFIQVYESFAEEGRPHQQRAKSALGGAFYVGGKDYVRNLFESSKKPPACNAPSDHMAPSAHAGEPLPQRIDLVRCETNTYGGGRGVPIRMCGILSVRSP